MHFIQEEADGQVIPWCRANSFSARVAEQGLNPLEVTFAHCTACTRRLPLDLQAALAKGQNDDSPVVTTSPSLVE